MVSENKSFSFKIEFPELKTHSQWASADYVLKKLQANGHEALIAGGAVRDLLMGRVPGDLDIASSAKPDEVEKLFLQQTVAVGKAFGVIRVIHLGQSIEVATYRQDLEYLDGRRPEGVVFTNRQEDAKRRDFTINAMFYDPQTSMLYDDVDGKKDIQNKILKCVGEASKRFKEDELRRLRLVRLVSQIGFQVDSETRKELEVKIEGIQKVSKERITEEVGKMWQGPYLPEAFKLWCESGMAAQVDPAWERGSTLNAGGIWKKPRDEKQKAWAHYFSFFLEETSLKNQFKLYKLPKDLEKFLEGVHQAYHSIPQFLKARKGEQRFQAAQPSFLLGFEYYIAKKVTGTETQKLTLILEQFKAADPLPEPLIKALQIQDQFQGPALGYQLKRLYLEQLDQNWKTSEQALAWLKQNPS